MYGDAFYEECMENADVYFNTILGDMGYVSEATDEELMARLNHHTDKLAHSVTRGLASKAVAYGAGRVAQNTTGFPRMGAYGVKHAANLGYNWHKYKSMYHAAAGGVNAARLGYRKIKRKIVGDPESRAPMNHGPAQTYANYDHYLQHYS